MGGIRAGIGVGIRVGGKTYFIDNALLKLSRINLSADICFLEICYIYIYIYI